MTSRPILPTSLVSTDWLAKHLAKHLGDPDLRVSRALDRRVIGGKFAESVVSTSSVNGGGPTLHQDADADRFGRLLFGCSGQNSPSRVCGDATVAPNRHPDGHAYQLFDFPLEGPGRQCRGAHLPVSAVYLWNHLTQSTALRIEVAKYFVVMVVVAHVSKQRVPRLNNCWHANDSSQQEASMAVILKTQQHRASGITGRA
jgi:hypothetical protein